MNKLINIKYIIFLLVLVYAGLIDYKTREIPDKVHIIIILSSLISNFYLKESLLGLIFLSITFLIPIFFSYSSIGGGDIKLAGAIGFFLGFERGVLAIVLGLILAIIIKRKDKLGFPLAPYLAVGSGLALII